jgi:hypothetical protein
VNVKERHTKGHQNERGAVIGTGPYESNFTWETFADDWLRLLQEWLSQFQQKVGEQMGYNPNAAELLLASNLHHTNVNAFYQRLGGHNNSSVIPRAFAACEKWQSIRSPAVTCCARRASRNTARLIKGYTPWQPALSMNVAPYSQHLGKFTSNHPWQVFAFCL